jgi:hypothetical protein
MGRVRVEQVPRAQARVVEVLQGPVYGAQPVTPPLLVDRVRAGQRAAGDPAQDHQRAARCGRGETAAEGTHRRTDRDPPALQVLGRGQSGLDRLPDARVDQPDQVAVRAGGHLPRL